MVMSSDSCKMYVVDHNCIKSINMATGHILSLVRDGYDSGIGEPWYIGGTQSGYAQFRSNIVFDPTTVIPESSLLYNDDQTIRRFELATDYRQVLRYILEPSGVLSMSWLCNDVWSIVAEYSTRLAHAVLTAAPTLMMACTDISVSVNDKGYRTGFWDITPSGVILMSVLYVGRKPLILVWSPVGGEIRLICSASVIKDEYHGIVICYVLNVVDQQRLIIVQQRSIRQFVPNHCNRW